MNQYRLKARPFLATAVAYLLLVVAMTWPLALNLTQRLAGNNIDNWLYVWNNWWLRQVIAHGESLFFTPYLFAPQGVSLIAHANSFLNSLLAYLPGQWWGQVAAHNLVFLFGLWLGSLGMFWLVWEMNGRFGGAFLAGFVYSFAPYHLTQALAHDHLGAIHWWPFFVLFWRRLWLPETELSPGARWRAALGAGLFAALTLWAGIQLAVLLLTWTAVYTLWLLLAKRRPGERLALVRLMPHVALVGATAVLLTTPMLIPKLQRWRELADTAAALNLHAISQTDLLAYWIPPTYHPFWGDQVVFIYQRFVDNQASMPYLGYAALCLALLALWQRRAEAAFWALSGLLWVTLAAGSILRFNGTTYPDVLLPYAWLGRLFPISAIRASDRFNLLLVLSLAVLVGLGADWLWQRARRWQYGRWLVLPITGLLILDYLIVPLPMWQLPAASPFLFAMRQEGQQYAVIDYPMGYTLSKRWLYFQTIHEKPMAEGHMSRYTAETYAAIAQRPLLNALYQPAEWPPLVDPRTFAPVLEDVPPANLSPLLRDLQRDGFRYLLVHRDFATAVDEAYLYRLLPLTPVYEDASLTVLDLRQPRPWQVGVPLLPGDGVRLLAVTGEINQAEDGETAVVHIHLLLQYDDPASPPTCQIRQPDTGAAAAFIPFAPAEAWQRGDLAAPQVIVPLPANLAPGHYTWQINCGAAQPLPLYLTVTPTGQQLLLNRPLDLQFGDFAHLTGYRWQQQGAALHLQLLWQALKTAERDYKLFVHLLDEGGNIVRQYDAMPCRWTCPTRSWQAGQLIVDEATLDVWGLPPGAYRLVLGLYDAITGERLSLVADGADAATLPEPVTIVWLAEME